MRIFITGGTGFIGTYLVKKLQERGHEICILAANLAEPEKWQKEIADFQPDALVHLAWEGLPDYGVEMSKKNIKYSLDLFSFLKEINCKKVLSVGSAFEKTIPEDIFPTSKNIVHLWGKALFESFIWARIFYVFGPGQRETSLIPYLINCAQKKEKPAIKNPLGQNDYIYIEDAAEAMAVLLESCDKGGEFEIGRGELISNQRLIEIVAQEFRIENWEKDIEITIKNEFAVAADNNELKALGWEPKINLEEGIKKTIDYHLLKK